MKTDFLTIQRLFVENNLNLTEVQFKKFEIYIDFLLEYNKKVNLTAITEPDVIWVKHFLDSIYPLSLVNIPKNSSIIDVGTGAGFPSVPMAIYRNDLNLTLLDSLQKRLVFLEQLAVKTGLNSWKCVHGRAEDMGRDNEYREKYDVAVARAVASLPVLCEYCLPFVKTDGYFIALKGPNECINDAYNAVSELGGTIENEIMYNLCGDDRKIVIIGKVSQTPTKYPRKSKRIRQMPL